ncbi:MAG: peptidoglycan-binding protein [Holosporales bacterium]|jgi:chemotaxis protein MotB|nr:peptidoglycan-binding protein [Holosporales bacterium]
MSFLRRRKNHEEMDIWPGFVDALSTVLLVFIFVLVGFISSQIYLSKIIFDKDSSLSDLRMKLSDVCTLLKSEQSKNSSLNEKNDDLVKQIVDLNNTINTLRGMLATEETARKETQKESLSLQEQIENLSQQLKNIMASLAAEQKTAEEQKQALERIRNENIKLSELSRMSMYRSEFFDKLQEIVSGRDGIKVVGDRFVFQAELFFESASDELSERGKAQVAELADVIKEIGSKIPDTIKWVLRVDGHTDSRPISGGKFVSNWELSSARAIAVVKYMVRRGIDPKRLVAAGFGEHQPIAPGKTDEDLAKNRRIEFKLDER